MRLAILMLAGCLNRPIEVVVARPIPGAPSASCTVVALGPPPKPFYERETPRPEDELQDAWQRMSIHRREYEDLLVWVKDLNAWAEQVTKCLQSINRAR